ncbi:unnamed protein product [Kuraishia capsulata CBS 1993]|uniref:CAP-Gly domain-containing protein n=1 Tax=Kuraishia capsulata CBS 1993 TaxID=1382522 RepID=W6MJQ9_9ASCO|nr:uncharacterized protein KUCA_T00000713001 [Kuraishia capsulata CBS 1993]CDK24747.1 unnamed protein product [Kuraishia capsulata CBS 1993]
MEGLRLEQRVSIQGNAGVVRFVGKTEFGKGDWVGVELDHAVGKNDGSVQGVRYFECQNTDSGALHGLFVRPTIVVSLSADSKRELGEQASSTDISREQKLELLVRRLEFKLKSSTQEIAALQQNIADFGLENQRLLVAIEELERSMENVVMERETFSDLSESLQSQLSELDNNYNLLLQEYAKAKNELLNSKEMEERSVALGRADPNNGMILAKNEALERDMERYSSREKSLLEKIELLEKETEKHTDILSTFNELQQKYAESQSALIELKSQLALLSESQELVESLTEKNVALCEEIEALEESIRQGAESNLTIGSLLTQSQANESKLMTQIEELTLEKKKCLENLETAAEENNSLVQEAETLRFQLRSNGAQALDGHGIADKSGSSLQRELALKTDRLKALQYQSRRQQVRLEKVEQRLLTAQRMIPDSDVKEALTKLGELSQLEQLAEELGAASSHLQARGPQFHDTSVQVAQLAAEYDYVLHNWRYSSDGSSRIADFISLMLSKTQELLEISQSGEPKELDLVLSAIHGDTGFFIDENLGPINRRENMIYRLRVEAFIPGKRCLAVLEALPQSEQTKNLLELLYKLCGEIEEKLDLLLQKRKNLQEVKSTFGTDTGSVLRDVLAEVRGKDRAFLEVSAEFTRRIEHCLEELTSMEITIQGTSVSYVDGILKLLKQKEEETRSNIEEAEKLKRDALDMALRLVSQNKLCGELSARIVALERRLENTKHSEDDLLWIRSKLDVLKSENENLLEMKLDLLSKNEELETKMNQIKRDNKLFGDFNTVYEEKEFAGKAELVSEIHSLRTAVSIFQDRRRKTVDLSWLNEEVYKAPEYVASTLEAGTRTLARTIVGIQSRYRVLPVGRYENWRPRASMPGHQANLMKEELGNYNSLKALVFGRKLVG